MKQRKKRRKRSAPSPFIWVLLGIGVLGVVAIALSRGGGDGEEGVATALVEVDGDPLDPPGEGVDPARGERAPVLRGIDFESEPVAITPGRRPMAIVFLAHWCPHCQAEVDDLEAWIADGNRFPQGVDVFAVSTLVDRARGNYPPGRWLEGFPMRVLVDDAGSSAADAYGLQGTPFWVFLDERGRVVERVSGVIEPGLLAERLEDLAA